MIRIFAPVVVEVVSLREEISPRSVCRLVGLCPTNKFGLFDPRTFAQKFQELSRVKRKNLVK
jgi:hypothetical protein